MFMMKGLYGAEAKQANNEADAKRADFVGGAQSSFYDTTESDKLKEAQHRRRLELEGRVAPQMEKTAFGSDAYASAAKVGPVAKATAPAVARRDLGPRALEMEALARMQQSALGKGPSIAGLQMNSGVDMALAERNARMGATRPGMAALAAHGIGNAAAANIGAASLGSAQTKLGEVAAGNQGFAGLSSGIRGSDLAMASAQAKHDTDASLFNSKAMNDASLANASFAQQAGAMNALAKQKETEMAQAAELANVEAALRNRGMTDSAIASVLASYQAQFNADNAAKQSFWNWRQDVGQFDQKTAYEKQKAAEQQDANTVNMMMQLMTFGAASGMGSGKGAGK